MDDPMRLEVTDLLDLHPFHPRDVPDLVGTWLAEAAAKGYAFVKIVHGKGTGALRETVFAVLRQSEHVAEFRLDDGPSGWGATIVRLKKE
jgi:dsDNA-specific endonuclease/ATPase MutS2